MCTLFAHLLLAPRCPSVYSTNFWAEGLQQLLTGSDLEQVLSSTLLCDDFNLERMCSRYLGFVLLILFPGMLHAQQSCSAPTLHGGFFAPQQETYSDGTKLTYSCDTGRKPAVKGWWVQSTCQNGKWSHEPQCIEEQACIPPEIPNGRYTESSNGWYEEGHKIRITCDKGYETKDLDATAICMSGMWSSVPVCEQSVSACSEPPKIPDAVVIHQEYQELFAEDSAVQYECKDGYTATEEDKKTIYCISGNWSEGPTCRSSGSSGSSGRDTDPQITTISRCGAPPIVLNSIVETYPMYLNYKCSVFYTRVGPEKVVCYNDGTWSQVPTCKDAFCSVNTEEYPALKPDGVKFVRDGETVRLECARQDQWWMDHYSVGRCANGRMTLSRCCSWVYLQTNTC